MSWSPAWACPARVREVFETTTFGVRATTRAVPPQFRERGSGVVVNVTSSVALGPMPLSAVHEASEMAVEGVHRLPRPRTRAEPGSDGASTPAERHLAVSAPGCSSRAGAPGPWRRSQGGRSRTPRPVRPPVPRRS
ncbi:MULTISPECIES: SDR family NAD(P)-dependent oxidoreductase [unclassified Streptomyces]|uniref:SDR family NAD(P)-dependent oxidoreductase n=1 Tax=unclassified Streptomyces TaxID=2593676 RepID=UPI001F30D954|nr:MULTISPECIES: SDR family NAD(P)-dependent oxidoreductase [unclassified Streptomyces]